MLLLVKGSNVTNIGAISSVVSILSVIVVSIVVLVVYTIKSHKENNFLPTEKQDETTIETADKELKNNKKERIIYKKETYSKEFFRYQKDKQNFNTRNELQQKIFDEYFVIKNYITKMYWLEVLGVLALIIGLIMLVYGLSQEQSYIPAAIFAIIIAAVSFIVVSTTKVCEPKKIMSDEEYEEISKKFLEELNVKERARKHFAIDNFSYDKAFVLTTQTLSDTSLSVHNAENNSLHSSEKQAIVFYLTEERLYLYKISYDMCQDYVTEQTQDFSFDKIDSLSTLSKLETATICEEKTFYTSSEFNIKTNNAVFTIQNYDISDTTVIFQGIHNLIRNRTQK